MIPSVITPEKQPTNIFPQSDSNHRDLAQIIKANKAQSAIKSEKASLNKDKTTHFLYTLLEWVKIGDFCFSHKNYQTSLECYLKIKDICSQIAGINNTLVSKLYINIGLSYFCLGEYENSLESFENALNINLKLYGLFHGSVAGIYEKIGYCFICIKKIQAGINRLGAAHLIRMRLHIQAENKVVDYLKAMINDYTLLLQID